VTMLNKTYPSWLKRATNSSHAGLKKWYGLQPTCNNYKTLLSRIISRIKLINMSRLATYAKHAKVTLAVYEITFCHDYKIFNVIQEILITTITSSHVLCLYSENKPSPISTGVAEIRINSQSCKGNNLTTRHMRAMKANEWWPFAMTIKESGWVLPHPSAIFHAKTLPSSPWVA
jgi:hypothetical protein